MRPKRGGRRGDARPTRDRDDARPTRDRDDARRPPKRPPHTSPRIPIPRGTPRPGVWLFTSREDATKDLADELRSALGEGGRVRVVEPGLVESRGAPTFEDGALDVTFARQGIPVLTRVSGAVEETASAIAALARSIGLAPEETIRLEAWAPDSDQGNRRMPACASLLERVHAALQALDAPLAARCSIGGSAVGARQGDTAQLVSLVSLADGTFALGAQPLHDALSPFPGGRARMRVGADRPSRASRKLEEALAWFGLAPSSGDVCVDLGAAPGGWSWALLDRRARVIAVDPALLRPDLMRHKNLRHVQASAFGFEPDEPVDWLFCDMAWRPLEVAELLAKWGRRRSARFVVANLKLPMKEKAKMLGELRAIVHGGGYTRIRTRQLYHDRDEITLLATR